jgi:hypothetical protein
MRTERELNLLWLDKAWRVRELRRKPQMFDA